MTGCPPIGLETGGTGPAHRIEMGRRNRFSQLAGLKFVNIHEGAPDIGVGERRDAAQTRRRI